MPYTIKKYIITAKANLERVGKEEPRYYWNLPGIELKVDNTVLSDKECSEIQGYVMGVVSKHTELFTSIHITVDEEEITTKNEGIRIDLDNAAKDLESALKGNEDGIVDYSAIDAAREKLDKLCKQNPEFEPPLVSSQPVLPVDYKCDDEDV